MFPTCMDNNNEKQLNPDKSVYGLIFFLYNHLKHILYIELLYILVINFKSDELLLRIDRETKKSILNI